MADFFDRKLACRYQTHLGTIGGNNRHGGAADVAGAHAANVKIISVTHIEYLVELGGGYAVD
jgi:hypothetical protein